MSIRKEIAKRSKPSYYPDFIDKFLLYTGLAMYAMGFVMLVMAFIRVITR